MAYLLLIDDDPALIPKQMRRAFPAPAHRVEVARTGAEGINCVRAEPPDVILLDLRLPDQSGLDVYRAIRRIDARIPVIFVTVAKAAGAAIEAMKQGAFDYLVKPVDLERLSALLGRAFEAARLMNVPAVLPAEDHGDRIVGRSPVMQEMCKVISWVNSISMPRMWRVPLFFPS